MILLLTYVLALTLIPVQVFAAIFIRALGLPSNGDSSVFNDVSDSEWYAGAVDKVYAHGIASGVNNVEFAPERSITRQEAMLMIQHAAKVAGFNGNKCIVKQ